MVTQTDASQKKLKFIKRAHRPWKPALSETIMQSPEGYLPKKPGFEPDLSIKSLELEDSLLQKSREIDTLNLKLSLEEDNRITLGGFLRPNKVFLSNTNVHSKHTSLMQDLKEKEKEILELTHNLKITQALEQVQLSEASRLAEIKAREAAEEKAIYALNKAQQAADFSRLAEERAYIAEQNALKLEQTLKQFEAEIHQKDQGTLSKFQKNHEEYTAKLKAQEHIFSEKLKLKEQSFNTILQQEQQKLDVLQNSYEALQHKYQWAENELAHYTKMLEEKEQTTNTRIMIISEQISQMEAYLNDAKRNHESLENEIVVLHEKLQQAALLQTTAEEKLLKNSEYLRKMSMALHVERNLRALYEEKAKLVASQVYNLEMQKNAEEHARKTAEEKAKQTLQQASKAVMQLLNV